MAETDEIIAAVCGECGAHMDAHWQPDFCGRCGTIRGPWTIIHLAISDDASSRLWHEYVGVWRDAAREEMPAHLRPPP